MDKLGFNLLDYVIHHLIRYASFVTFLYSEL